MKKIGAFVGKFYPPHIGHLSVIDNAIDYFDEVYVIISYNNLRNKSIKENHDFDELDPKLIKSWFEDYYKNQPKVKVAIFDESGLMPYPNDQDKWAKKFKKQFPTVNYKIADGGYREFNERFFPEYGFYEIDRELIPIHSTMIRNNMQKYLRYLIPNAREYFKDKFKEGDL